MRDQNMIEMQDALRCSLTCMDSEPPYCSLALGNRYPSAINTKQTMI